MERREGCGVRLRVDPPCAFFIPTLNNLKREAIEDGPQCFTPIRRDRNHRRPHKQISIPDHSPRRGTPTPCTADARAHPPVRQSRVPTNALRSTPHRRPMRHTRAVLSAAPSPSPGPSLAGGEAQAPHSRPPRARRAAPAPSAAPRCPRVPTPSALRHSAPRLTRPLSARRPAASVLLGARSPLAASRLSLSRPISRAPRHARTYHASGTLLGPPRQIGPDDPRLFSLCRPTSTDRNPDPSVVRPRRCFSLT